MSTTPQKHRRFMIPFLSEDQGVSILMLNANKYSDAIKIARCVCGHSPEKFLCYKDFLVYD